MSPWALLLLTSIVLLLPRLLLQQVKSKSRAHGQPEIHGLLRVMEAINTFYCCFWHRLSVDRWAPLPVEGPAILISNHTCGIDHLLLQAATRRVLGFMVAREYYEWPLVNWDLPIHRLHPGEPRRPGFVRPFERVCGSCRTAVSCRFFPKAISHRRRAEGSMN